MHVCLFVSRLGPPVVNIEARAKRGLQHAGGASQEKTRETCICVPVSRRENMWPFTP